jgi:hypothetical protein
MSRRDFRTMLQMVSVDQEVVSVIADIVALDVEMIEGLVGLSDANQQMVINSVGHFFTECYEVFLTSLRGQNEPSMRMLAWHMESDFMFWARPRMGPVLLWVEQDYTSSGLKVRKYELIH